MNRSDGPETPADLRAALRQRTAAAHRRLDGLPQQRALVRPGLTRAEYVAILSSHARAQAACEARMARVAAARPADLAPYRSRLPALRADLARLSEVPAARGRPAAQASQAVPADPALPALPADPTTPPAADAHAAPLDPVEAEGRYLGFRYVLDGATQGARWIAPRLAENLPEIASEGFAFWRLQQDEATTWPEVTRALAARPAHGRLARAAAAAACEAFDVFLVAFGAVEGAPGARAEGELLASDRPIAALGPQPAGGTVPVDDESAT